MNTDPRSIPIKLYNYHLPNEKIAHFPLQKRDQSRLLIYKNGIINDGHFYDLPDHLPEGSTVVVNDTRVIEARILFQKPTGGTIEIFCLEPHAQSMELSLSQQAQATWLCLIGGASKWKAGQLLTRDIELSGQQVILTARYLARETDGFLIEFSWQPGQFSFSEILHAAGNIPLPPYIKREATETDKQAYQTIFSRQEGSVAAPTAALHFTAEVFEKMAAKNITLEHITLHVGAGTFKPVKTETIADHQMHHEPFTLTRRSLQSIMEASTLITVGTTSLRTVESIYWLGVKLLCTGLLKDWRLDQWEAYELAETFPEITPRQSLETILEWMDQTGSEEVHCRTGLMITPGYAFKIARGLITNFHQPQSTLLLLVSAFVGEDWKKIYDHAMEHDYRFLSYGDSSLLWRRDV